MNLHKALLENLTLVRYTAPSSEPSLVRFLLMQDWQYATHMQLVL